MQKLRDGSVMPWSFKEQRRFIEMAASAKSFDELVKRTGRQPKHVRAAALRLGVKLGKQIAPDNQLATELRAKAKRAKIPH
ncbi:MAG: hypothetical protein J0H42_25740 [Rhizobiales bacterium]|nr:hypothetical protein [Hyphomicrobiales bacterium]